MFSKNLKILTFICFTVLLCSCSSLSRMAINSLSPVFIKSETFTKNESDWENFKQSIPPLLKLYEVLYEEDDDNIHLLRNLVRGHFAYGYLVYETQALRDKYDNKENIKDYDKAKRSYSHALNYNAELFRHNNVGFTQFEKMLRKNTFAKYLNDHVKSDEEIKDVFYFGALIFALINLDKDNPTILSKMELAKQLIDFSCEKLPQLENGMCLAFEGMYYLSRPKMLGGDPEKGKDFFNKAFEKYPSNYFLRALYTENYSIPYEDKKELEVQMIILEDFREDYSRNLRWNGDFDSLKLVQDPLNLYNATALRRLIDYKSQSKALFSAE